MMNHADCGDLSFFFGGLGGGSRRKLPVRSSQKRAFLSGEKESLHQECDHSGLAIRNHCLELIDIS